ncbi:hypothetical protein bcgnr5384_15420 [Bacillus cereus]
MKEKSQPLKFVLALSNKVKNNGSRFIIVSSYFISKWYDEKRKKEDLLLKGNGFKFRARIDSYKFAPCENGYLYILDFWVEFL